MAETKPQEKCKICAKTFHPYHMGEKNGYRLVACKSCGTVMTEPYPTQEAITLFFGEIQPEPTHLPNPEGEIQAARKAIEKAGGANGAGKNFLDVTARQGYAVMAAKSLGYEAKGIDQFEFFARFAQEKYGADLFAKMTAMELAEQGKTFDFIFSQDSFCEQADPEKFTAALARLLAPGGTLYIQEPDGNSMNLPRKFQNWVFVEPPVNFLYLSKTGLTAMLARHGLSVQKIFFTWSPQIRMIVTRQ